MTPHVASQADRTSSTQRQPRPRRDLKAMEERRLQAADLFRRGVIPAEIARRLGVSHQVVSEWRKAWRQGGRAALRSAGRVGRPAKLSMVQLTKVEKALTKGAEANGYVSDVWTLPRVAEVIEHLTGVAYHPGYVWYHLDLELDNLRGTLDWCLRAKEPCLDSAWPPRFFPSGSPSGAVP